MNLADYEPLFDLIQKTPLALWLDRLPGQIATALDDDRHGRLPEWRQIVDELPAANPSTINLLDGVTIGRRSDLAPEAFTRLEAQLRRLHPWRKGPFRLFGLHIDSEWRSDWKWDRVKEGIQPLNGRLVLDVGCGNGYYGWRMAGRGAQLVVGLDPYLLYVAQFQAVRTFVGDVAPAFVLPLGIEALPERVVAFDTVFSMGVLYHRRNPMEHLQTLLGCLRPGGELVLETLIMEGGQGEVLVPKDRYARMRNVWLIPSVPTLLGWLAGCGFLEATLLNVTATTVAEQRTTDWMRFHSLADFLDPRDPSRTIEGYPAPRRAVIVAKRPS